VEWVDLVASADAVADDVNGRFLPLPLMLRVNKLKCLTLDKPSKLSLIIVGWLWPFSQILG
jgi:hypothetical protein